MTGTHNLGFDRLTKAADNLGKKYTVVIQKGASSYTPLNSKCFDYCKLENIQKEIENADVIITHGGIGCVSDSLRCGKPTVVVPRLKKFGEHTDDHQLDLTKRLEEEGKIIAVYDVADIKNAVEDASKMKLCGVERGKTIEIIKAFLSKVK